MHRHALFIDAMGTLVRLHEPVPRLRAALRAELGVVVTEAEAASALAAEILHYRAHMHEAADDVRLERLRAECALVLRDALPPSSPLAGAETETMTAVLLRALRFVAFADARAALVRAHRARARVIVVSNWDVSLAEALEWTGLAPLLDGVLTSAAVGVGKPNAGIFTAALALAGPDVAPERCVHVGDSLREDVVGARAAGIEPVLLRRTGTVTGAGDTVAGADGVRVISTLDDLDLRS